MNPILLHDRPPSDQAAAPPLFALESNYDYTSKYRRQSRRVEQASLTLLFFADSIVLLPRSGNGRRMLEALEARLPLRRDARDEQARSLALDAAAPLRHRLEQLRQLPAHFQADAGFGLYGFFAYELIHAQLGLPCDLLGIFHLPERLLADGQARGYFIGPAADDGQAPPPPDLARFIDIDRFAAGRCQPYEQIYRAVSLRIADGALRSVNPSFVIRRPTTRSAYQIYRALQENNLAPYNLFFDAGAFQLAGASPAMFLRIHGGRVETSPICGTAARGRSEEEDRLRMETLLASEKDGFELAECIRADIAAKEASCQDVELLAAKEIEKFANVFHTSAHVGATLKAGCTPGDAIADHLWPATIIGTPAADAARLLAGQESRHWYGGAFGYLTAAGEVNLGTIIRTALIRDGVATTRVGSTLTRHSSAQLEQQELEAKAALILGVL
ncbi:chorismate-binding protein [Chromobacterium sphagni]|uniref:Chorismate-utilising enzyme C-terminal domain-containing protein n=1 Tax=Chromobacterium sphagni TaxID=1903179 RepID=A0A1S1WZA0_9NEIS|nr:chorismate-binding protein [Chromobacterium sphagni]OHX12450.1 hypothetical protein BI347_02260 [Chromobacterium sphagni]OHX21466.1 hypothetical protein BI344_02745 [Chromobacterium sphagni]